MTKQKFGFTLAEVLIVIGIIGVVAALTLPNLNHATGDKETVTRVKKIYSALTEAIDRAQVVYGNFDTWFTDLNGDPYKGPERFAKRVTEFMKVSKECGFTSGCWPESDLIDISGNSFGDPGRSAYSILLSDNTALTFNVANDEFSTIRVDIDGPNKGKKQMGKDIFDFTIYTDESAANSEGAQINQLIPSKEPNHMTGDLSARPAFQYETAWVIENGNLDYLKCLDELNWETKTSCQ